MNPACRVFVRVSAIGVLCLLSATTVPGNVLWSQQQLANAAAAPVVDDAAPQAPSTPPQRPPSSSKLKPKKTDCPHPADPCRRRKVCHNEDFDWDETLTRDWNGLRSELRKLGIAPSFSYNGALQTNLSGKTHQIWGYTGQLVAALNVDLDKLFKVPGLSAYVAGSWGTGDNLSGSLHNLFAVNSLYAPSYYLGEMYLQQTLLKQKLTLAGGRISASNTFATLPIFSNYVNYGLNPNPYALGGNDVTFFGPPSGTEWGAQASYNITPKLQAAAGIFNTNVNSANGQNHGTDWTLQQGNRGALVTAQVSYYPHGIVTDEGKQGLYTVGIITNNNLVSTLPDGEAQGGGYAGAFILAQETIYQPDGPNTLRGVTVWGSWAYNAKPLISPIPVFWAAGASYQGLLKSRPNDAASIGWIYGQVSNYVPHVAAEQVLEANYRWMYGKFLSLTPDFQYIWSPGGQSARGIAVVGAQIAISF